MFLTLSVLNAINGLMTFYAKSFEGLNVDGLFGLRIIEGQLKHIAYDYELGKYKKAHPSVIKSIKNLSSEAGRIANIAVPHVYSGDAAYFTQFRNLISRPWTPLFDPILTNRSFVWPSDVISQRVEWSESDVDKCLAELLLPECNVSETCLTKMLLTRGTIAYTLQHQLLYYLIADCMNCLAPLRDFGQKHFKLGLPEFALEFCTNSLVELEATMAKVDFQCIASAKEPQSCTHNWSTFNIDLFFEQQFVCGQLGFVEFARAEWLVAVLQVQDASGCFTQRARRNSPEESGPTGRKLRMEKQMEGNCGAHISAVAAGALLVYLRFLLEEKNASTPIGRLLNENLASSRAEALFAASLGSLRRFLPSDLASLHRLSVDFEPRKRSPIQTLGVDDGSLLQENWSVVFLVCLTAVGMFVFWRLYTRNERTLNRRKMAHILYKV